MHSFRRMGWVGLGLWAGLWAWPAFAGWGRLDDPQARRLRDAAIPLPDVSALDPLLERASGRRAVFLGENTHGTSEFYAWRTKISLALIDRYGFRFIAVEGDGDAWHALRPYLAGCPSAPDTAAEALRVFSRWPVWLWANEETAALVDALRERNASRPPDEQVFLYGLDLYGAPTALPALLEAIAGHDPAGVSAFENEYRTLRSYGADWAAYARAIARGGTPSDGAERAVERLRGWLDERTDLDPAEAFRLKHLALIIRDAERHYRAMARSGPESWNTRADHFYTVFERLLHRYGPDAKGIAWAHNTHIGDARATPMAAQGQRNLGQTARERLGRADVLLVGLTGGRGRVIAGRQWGGPWRDKQMPSPRAGSLEGTLKQMEHDRLLLLFNGDPLFSGRIPHRAIGVVYQPELDSVQNYVPTDVGNRYDALLFFRDTTPLRLLAP